MSQAHEVVELLKGNTFFLATVEGDQPRVRPFGAVMEYEGKFYTCTNNKKKVFKQIVANPKVEIAAMIPNSGWLRITCALKADPRREAKVAMLEAMPNLRKMYNEDDGTFEVLYIESGTAVHNAPGGPKEYTL